MKPKLSDIIKYLKKNDNVADTSKPSSSVKELPSVIIKDKGYNDSLNLYNASLNMAKDMAKALSKGSYDASINYGISKPIAEREYKKDIEYYTKQLVEPITKGKKPKFGSINKYNKQTEDYINKEEKPYYAHQRIASDHNSTRYLSEAFIKGYEKLDKLNKKIKPIAYSSAAELPDIPIYKKPVGRVENKKPETKKEVKKSEPVKKEQPRTVEKKQNKYEGSPVYSPGAGSGMPSALVGFMSKGGDTTYIKPEDYERFAVPKYGKAFIESKSKKK